MASNHQVSEAAAAKFYEQLTGETIIWDPKGTAKVTWSVWGGELTHITMITKPMQFGNTCFGCGEPLTPSMGTELTWHFKHKRASSCNGGYETLIHRMGKEAVADLSEIRVAKILCKSEVIEDLKTELWSAEIMEYDDPVLEKGFEDVIPDVTVKHEGSDVFIEIFVSNEVDEEKLEKLERIGIDTLEIDLSRLRDSGEEITKNLIVDYVSSLAPREWVWSESEKRELYRFHILEEVHLMKMDLIEDEKLQIERRDLLQERTQLFYKDFMSVREDRPACDDHLIEMLEDAGLRAHRLLESGREVQQVRRTLAECDKHLDILDGVLGECGHSRGDLNLALDAAARAQDILDEIEETYNEMRKTITRDDAGRDSAQSDFEIGVWEGLRQSVQDPGPEFVTSTDSLTKTFNARKTAFSAVSRLKALLDRVDSASFS